MTGNPLIIAGYHGPMRAMNYEPRLLKLPAMVQPKLDGARCIATCGRNQSVHLQSNGGHRLDLPHISAALGNLMSENEVWDGELYVHGCNFDDIMAMIRARDEKLQFHVFDRVTDAPAYSRRFSRMQQLQGTIVTVPTVAIEDADDIQALYDMAINDGYEGIIIRDPDAAYIRGRASPALLRLKQTEDSEFRAEGYRQATDGSLVFQCVTRGGKGFCARLPRGGAVGPDTDDGPEVIVTVRHQGWTARGLPRNPHAIRVRPGFDINWKNIK